MSENGEARKELRVMLPGVTLDMYWYWQDTEWMDIFASGPHGFSRYDDDWHPEVWHGNLPVSGMLLIHNVPRDRSGKWGTYLYVKVIHDTYAIGWALESRKDGSVVGIIRAWHERSDQLRVLAMESVPELFIDNLQAWLKERFGADVTQDSNIVVPLNQPWQERLAYVRGWPKAWEKGMLQHEYARNVCKIEAGDPARILRDWKKTLEQTYGYSVLWPDARQRNTKAGSR